MPVEIFELIAKEARHPLTLVNLARCNKFFRQIIKDDDVETNHSFRPVWKRVRRTFAVPHDISVNSYVYRDHPIPEPPVTMTEYDYAILLFSGDRCEVS